MHLPTVMHLHRSPSLENQEFLLGMNRRSSFTNRDRISIKDLHILGFAQDLLLHNRILMGKDPINDINEQRSDLFQIE